MSTPELLNFSMRMLHDTILVEGSNSEDFLCNQGFCWIDVRDVAEAHVLSLQRENAGGERIIVSAGI